MQGCLFQDDLKQTVSALPAITRYFTFVALHLFDSHIYRRSLDTHQSSSSSSLSLALFRADTLRVRKSYHHHEQWLLQDVCVCAAYEALPDKSRCYEQGLFTDLLLVCQGREFRVHKIILAGQSTSFHKACTVAMKVGSQSAVLVFRVFSQDAGKSRVSHRTSR